MTTKPQCLERLTEIAATVDRLLAGNCTYPKQERAYQEAHKLVGTLEVFSLMSAMEIARKIEGSLDRANLLPATEAAPLQTLLGELAREIEDTEPSQTMNVPSPVRAASASPNLPLLLLIDLEPNLTLSLTAMAKDRGLQTLVVSKIEAAYSYLSTLPDAPVNILSPTLVLVSLSASQEYSITSHPRLGFIHNVNQRFPHWSVLVLSERNGLNDRLAVVQHGGKFLCTTALTTEQIFTAATSLLQFATATAKVMVVDDDLDWLRALPQLLQPWGMKVTTLADPQQFWTVLQAVQPDAVVLDVNMPEINGLELCQVLRSDPSWQHLPILCLSAINDPLSQQEAFSVGADDYLCKPVMGEELAQRIRHRLVRLQAGQVAT